MNREKKMEYYLEQWDLLAEYEYREEDGALP